MMTLQCYEIFLTFPSVLVDIFVLIPNNSERVVQKFAE